MRRLAHRAANELYGVPLGEPQQRKLVRQVQEGEARFLERKARWTTIWEVTLEDGQKAVAVYDRRRKIIATLLPRAAAERYDHREEAETNAEGE